MVILTTFDLDEYVYQALRAGASGFLLKSARPPRTRRRPYAPPRAATPCSPHRSPDGSVEAFVRPAPYRHSERRAPNYSLTKRELEVLPPHRGAGSSNAEIAKLLGTSADETVKTHASRIFMKLGVRDRTQAVILAYEYGVVEPAAPPSR